VRASTLQALRIKDMNEVNIGDCGFARLSASSFNRRAVSPSGPLAPSSFNFLIAAFTLYRSERNSFNVRVVVKPATRTKDGLVPLTATGLCTSR